MDDPSETPVKESVIDKRINLPTIISLVALIFGGGTAVAQFETQANHLADMKTADMRYVHQDVSIETDRELRESVRRLQDQLDRIETFLHTK